MGVRKAVWGLTLAVAATGSGACSGPDGGEQERSDDAPGIGTPGSLAQLNASALERARRSLGGAIKDIELLAAKQEHYPASGRTVYRWEFTSRATGQIEQVNLDEAGRSVDDFQVREDERLARLARYGHLRPKLAERIADMADDAKLWVVAYLPVTESHAGAASDRLSDPAELALEQARLRSEVELGLRRLLAALGDVEHVPAADGSPWVRLHLTVAELRRLSRTDLVGAIFDGKARPREALSQNADHYALSNIGAAHTTYGLLGSGVRVATLTEIVPPNPNLPFNPYGARSRLPFKSPCNEDCNTHGSDVMGFIQNTNPHDPETPPLTTTGGNKGVAPLATLYNSSATEVVGTLIRSSRFTPAVGNGSHTWTSVAGTATYSPSVWQALPDSGDAYVLADYTSAPRLDYTMDFPITGTYYVWVRGKCVAASCGGSDSVHVGVDGVLTASSDAVGSYGSSFAWKSRSYPDGARPTINIATAGPHQINVWMREDGFTFDALMITPDAAFTPTEEYDNPRFAFTRDKGTAMDQYSWLASRSVRVVNLSMGGPCSATECTEQDLTDMVADYYATHSPFMLSVFSAGNFGSSGTYGNVVSNFLYNGLVVGGAQPKCYTVPGSCTMGWQSTDRTLDHTIPNWVYQNPFIGVDWELPHLVAYAKGLHYPLSAFSEASGTSFSAPQVAGAAALVIGGNTTLLGRPEGVKAVLMAGADVNTDLNSPSMGASHSYRPRYNALGFGVGPDRRGGVGLLNVEASAEISRPARRIPIDNRFGLDSSYALGGATAGIVSYQAGITPTQAPWAVELAPGTHGGFDVGSMDPAVDFDGIWYKHYYYVRPTVSGNLRVALVWNRPFTCSGTPVTCGADAHPTLRLIVHDLDFPNTSIANGVAWEPNEAFLVAPVVAGKTYRISMYKQNFWPGALSYGLAAYMTANPQ